MKVTKRSIATVSLVCLVLLAAAATVGAATITGTAGNDMLRGGPKADKLNGKGGNDKLYSGAGNDVLIGGAGNDLLVGGPGADKLSCGPGTDIARGDATDTIAKDCEKVTGVPAAPPLPPPPPAPPRLPRSRPVTPGQYQGQTQNGNFVFFTVTPSRTVTGMRINDLPDQCNGGLSISGGDDFGDSTSRSGTTEPSPPRAVGRIGRPGRRRAGRTGTSRSPVASSPPRPRLERSSRTTG